LLLGEMESHERVCPLKPKPCSFANCGCEFEGAEATLVDHRAESVQQHLGQMHTVTFRMLTQLQLEMRQQMHDMDKRLQAVERSLMAQEPIRVSWVIRGFSTASSRRRRQFMQSLSFTYCDLEWFFGLYPEGDSESSRGSVSLYLFLDTPEPKMQLKLSFTLEIVNAISPASSVRSEYCKQFPVTNGQGWGDRHLSTSALIRDEPGFLIDDTLTIRSELSCKKITWNV
jgi:MATH domain